MERKTKLITVAEIELVYTSSVSPLKRPEITSSLGAYELLMNSWNLKKMELVEQFKVLYLNTANRVLGLYQLSSGGITGTVADPRLVFAAALKINAVSLILCHNHPSGNLKPSIADEQLTQKIKGAGQLLDIKVLDHLILTPYGYYSFADEGIL